MTLVRLQTLTRVRQLLAELAELHPDLIDHAACGADNRTAWETTLREDDMTRTEPAWTTVRIPADLVDRAAALRQRLAVVPEIRARGPVNRATVVRLALIYGLDRLEADYPE